MLPTTNVELHNTERVQIKMDELKIGASGTANTTVTEKNTAKTVGSGSLEVFSTPMMIALMEEAACNCLANYLEAGQTSVGTMINAAHMAASPVGAKITATATVGVVEKRKITFIVTAQDGNNVEIGKGSHERFIVDADRFMEKLQK
jgi:predicted thioesterase